MNVQSGTSIARSDYLALSRPDPFLEGRGQLRALTWGGHPNVRERTKPLRARQPSAPYAAARFAFNHPRLTITSAIWTAFSAAPLRRLSETTQRLRPFSIVGSSRIREI